MQGVILAAGRGERLRPITLTRSKGMAPVLGKPIVERVMETLVANGVDDFVVVANPEDGEMIRYFRAQPEMDASVRLVHQGERLGTADALRCAAPLINGDFLLSACDSLVAAEEVGRLQAAWQRSPRPSAVLALIHVEPEQVSQGAVVEMDGPWVTHIVEKPSPEEAPSNLYSLPLYGFSPRILDYLPDVPRSLRGEYELPDAIQMLIEHGGRVRGVTIPHRLTLTNPQDLLLINRHYLVEGDEAWPFAPRAVGLHTQLIPPLCIEEGTVIGERCTIGPNVYVERDCHVGNGVTLTDAVVLRGSVVPEGATICEQVVAPADE